MRKILACISVLAGLCTAAPVLAQQKEPADMTGAYQYDAQPPRTIVVGEAAQNKDPADPANRVMPPIAVPQNSNHVPATQFDALPGDIQEWIREVSLAAGNDPDRIAETKAYIAWKLENWFAFQYGGGDGGIAGGQINDDCGNALCFSGASVSGTTAGASNSGAPACISTLSPDVWYLYLPSADGTAVFSTCGSAYDTALSAYTGGCCALARVACNDDAQCPAGGPFTLQSRISFAVTAGTPYLIRVGGFSSQSGAFTLTLESGPAANPCNDSCANAVCFTGTTNGSTIGATADAPPGCFGTPDVWYRYTPALNGTAVFMTCGGITNYDTVLSAYSGTCAGGLAQLACNDDSCGLLSRISFAVTAGQTYLVRVAGFIGTGNFTLTLESGPAPLACPVPSCAPANDDCAAAIALPGTSGSVNGTTIDATNDNNSCFATPDVWYTVTNPQCVAGTLDLNTCTSGYDTVLSVHDACGNAAIACNDDCFIGGVPCQFTLQSCLSLAIPANTTYLVRVAGFSGTGNFTLNYNISYPPPANNDCVNAAAVGAGVTAYTNVGATTDGPSSCGILGSDVWFIYRASCTQTVTATTCSANRTYDTVMAVYDTTACPGALIGCNDDGPPSCTNPGVPFSGSTVTWNATCGATYLIQVAGFGGAQGCSDLTITETPIAPPNDNCGAAIPVGAGTTPYTNCNATTDGPQPCGGIGSDVWFVYNHPGGNVATTITTCSPVRTYDTVLAVYAGSCAGAPVACNDDGPPFCSNPGVPFSGSTVTIQSCAAQTYLIQVGGFLGAQGCSELTISEAAAAPFNDNCGSATFITDGVYPYGNIGATTDGPAACGLMGADVWYLYQASCTGVATATTCSPNRTYDTVMAVYDATACPGAELGCNDDGPPFCANTGVPFSGSTVSWNATAGTLYLIRVGGFNGAQGCSDLTVSCAGNTCAGFLRGDSDGSLAVNNFDIDPFVLAISDSATYIAAFCGGDPNCYVCRNDINGDNAVNDFDIDSFVNCLNNLPAPGQPCP